MVNRSRGEESAIVLMSTLAAAADVVHGMAERRQGRDPSAQEDPIVAGAWLRSAVEEIDDYLLSLQAGRVLEGSEPADGPHSLSRRMTQVMILNHLSRLLHVAHQRMLSLYPGVPEELVEEARLLYADCVSLRDEEREGTDLFLRRAHALCRDIQGRIP